MAYSLRKIRLFRLLACIHPRVIYILHHDYSWVKHGRTIDIISPVDTLSRNLEFSMELECRSFWLSFYREFAHMHPCSRFDTFQKGDTMNMVVNDPVNEKKTYVAFQLMRMRFSLLTVSTPRLFNAP